MGSALYEVGKPKSCELIKLTKGNFAKVEVNQMNQALK
jgi:hypothetical protein